MNKVVIGLGFGDEGKGLVTDWLCSSKPKSFNDLVVRFSGGHQVGHTVVIDEKRHVFSNFGSGTLRGIPTYWSKFCTVNPITLINELDVLIKDGKYPDLMIDQNCPITTPYDVLENQLNDEYNRNGTCGLGFGATIKRELDLYSLKFKDLFYPKILEEKLKNIRDYYKSKFTYRVDLTEFHNCIKAIHDYPKIGNVNGIEQVKSAFSNLIFEGSQGLLLDQHFGFYPNVTWSDLGLKNVIELNESNDVDLYLVTRAYQTRHGNGFMTNENIPHNIKNEPLETNVSNKYQGDFRKTLLDLDLIHYAISQDRNIAKCKNKNLVITCLDHIENDYRFTCDGKIVKASNEKDFIDSILSNYNFRIVFKNVYLSHSPEGKYLKRKT